MTISKPSRRLLGATRRQILRTVGLSGVASAAGARLFQPIAHAAEIPKRLVVFYTIGGVDPAWDPQGTRDDWTLSDHLSPLQPFKNKLNLIKGLDSSSFQLFGTTGEGAHITRSQHALASWRPGPNGKPGGVSFDNFIAEKLRAAGGAAPIDHLYVQGSASVSYHDHDLRPSVRSSGEIRNPIESPADILKLYFPFQGSQPATPDPNTETSSHHLMDFLKGEYDRYAKAGKMDAQSKRRFSDHLDRLNDLSALLPGSGGTVAQACKKPGLPSANDLVTRNRFMVEAVATALACDTARVALIDMAWGINGSLVGGLSEFNLGDGLQTLHELGHQVHNGRLESNPSARAKLLKSFRLQGIDPLAQMLTLMDSIEEADGKTLLDHSVVLWCQQSSDGGHSMKGFRYLIAGSGGGYFKTNQFLEATGRSTAEVWVSVANAMGIADVKGIADPATYEGPLAGLR